MVDLNKTYKQISEDDEEESNERTFGDSDY